MSDQAFVDGWLQVLREAMEGGLPGQGTAFLDGTNTDGTGNKGLLATLERLSSTQASNSTPLGQGIAAHTAHTAYHMEVTVRYVNGDRGPFDWPGSFSPSTVDEAEWAKQRARIKAAYESVLNLAKTTPNWDEDSAGGLAATLAHVCYHLGAIRQLIKLV
jgi:hypothetical protein